MKLRHLRIPSIVVLLVFTWTILGVSNLALAITSASDAAATTDNPLIALCVQTRALANSLRNIQAGLQQGQDQTDQLTAAANQLNELLALQDPVAVKLAEIKANPPQNGSVPQEVLDRQAALVQKVQEGFTVLGNIATNLSQLSARGNVGAVDLAPLVAAINDLAPPPAADITNAMHKLPHRRLHIAPRHLVARPAIKSGLNLPGPLDLAATKDAPITPEIAALAQQLHYDPLKIFLYVRNTIDYQPYYGSVKGSLGAYWEKAGNDVDQASFLIALFRASDIPARYISGEVQLDLDRLMNWTGAQTPEVAVKILQTHGIPLQTVTNRRGNLMGVKFSHTWVAAYIGPRHHHDRDHHGHGQGCAGGHQWVQLDPSFKHYEYTAGIDLKQATGFDPDAFYNAATAGATINQDQSYVTNLNQANIQGNLQAYADNLLAWVNANLPNATVGDVLGGRKIREIHLHHLVRHKVFPFRICTPQAELSELPDSQRYLARFQMYGFTYDISLPELYGKRFTLDYVPASDYDQQMIDAAGGIYNVFAAFVYMKPQLKLEGQVVAEGLGVSLGSTQICTSSFLRPLGTVWDSNDKYVTTGADYSISLDHQRISADLLKQRVATFQNLLSDLPANTTAQEVVEEALHLTGLVYFAEVDSMSDVAARMTKITWTRDPSQDFIARDLIVISFFGLILQVQPGSVGMDVKRNIVGPVSLTGKAEDERTWMLSAGSFGSAAEHGVFEQIYGLESVSTEKILYLANQQGIPIYTINQDNINQILPLISAPAVVKQNISDSVLNSGWTAVVPQRGLQVNKWFGYGWQILDPNSGAAGYLLAGYLTSGSEFITAGGSGTDPILADMGSFWVKFWLSGIVIEALNEFIAKPGLGLMIAAWEAGLLLIPNMLGFAVGLIMVAFAIIAVIIILKAIWTSYIIRRRWYASKRKIMMFA
jgi:transglutaminase-like putative cysteine protease